MPNIVFNRFVRRQTPQSRFGHTTCSDDEVLSRLRANWFRRKKGYRDGVLLVPVEPDGFFSSTVELQTGMPLRASFEPRRPGEDPRLHVGVAPPVGVDGKPDYESAKQAAVAVDIVLYSSGTLAEDGDNELPVAPDNWEIIAILPRMCEEEEPMPPDTLMANHFHESGGTQTNMTSEEFVEALRVSRAYWKNKAMLG